MTTVIDSRCYGCTYKSSCIHRNEGCDGDHYDEAQKAVDRRNIIEDLDNLDIERDKW